VSEAAQCLCSHSPTYHEVLSFLLQNPASKSDQSFSFCSFSAQCIFDVGVGKASVLEAQTYSGLEMPNQESLYLSLQNRNGAPNNQADFVFPLLSSGLKLK